MSDTKVEPSTHPHAVKYLESYDEFKEELMNILFKIYNSEIFGGHLPYNMKLFWSKTLFKTAGKCYCKNEGLYNFKDNLLTRPHYMKNNFKTS